MSDADNGIESACWEGAKDFMLREAALKFISVTGKRFDSYSAKGVLGAVLRDSDKSIRQDMTHPLVGDL